MLLRNDSGFTLIEHLIGLSLIALVALLLPNFLISIQAKTISVQPDIVVFLNHVSKEAKEADALMWRDDTIFIYQKDSVITYELRNNKRIQRYRDGKGVVIMAEDVNEFICLPKEIAYFCQIELESGKRYERSFWSVKEWATHALE
ncbi:prepilin-type N-terminal cleavage/methylation domain-containing protein [Alkalihalobacillus xiaoxiensis]|uniref:Prepilin-type N-terminal cleavage/methylation domain-containing protein n=1 Tax=Shouchella xiaoxiensis TaxID=766895 RepID=A0ABS2SXS8_9BACI|nr:competence type IV pilus minor pilin ComGF [Shouchella xiaoxiensis]MBM7840337.1 prepilin-type N-terminal cleavage/methylation domain-containing protein [Shouchella xiaoxiensis]